MSTGVIKRHFEDAIRSEHYKVKESSRAVRGIPSRGRNGNPTIAVTGGGVALIYNEENFTVEDEVVETPKGVEAAWVILNPETNQLSVKKILIGGIYIAPRLRYKQEL